jgi:nucleotide-binding universal stress UspA family protein
MAATSVIAATDGSAGSLRAVEWAAREAVLRGEPLRIVSVPALPPRMSPDPGHRETVAGIIHHAARMALDTAAERAAELEPGLAVSTELLDGPPVQALLDAGAGASMLVVGSRGAGGFSAMVLGSVGRYLATHAPCPVVVAREETMAVHRQVVVGVRDPDASAAVLEFAFREAALRKAGLLAVHAVSWSLPPMISAGKLTAEQRAALDAMRDQSETITRLDDVLALWRHKHPDVETSWEVVHAHPARVLAGVSARADLVVLGRPAAGIAAGSIIHGVLGHAHGPVAIVPGGAEGADHADDR